MAYQATTLRILISCPGDVPVEDLSTVHKAITRWNVLLGEQFQHVVVPVSWSEHAASEFGEPPQDILNRQLVDVVDLGVAIFWNRLGTPTDVAESGTAEEIRRLSAAGKPVSVLRCNRPVPPRGDHEERARLDAHLSELYGRALVVNYDSEAGLASQVDTILTRMVTTHEHEWEGSGQAGSAGPRRSGAVIVPAVTEKRMVEPDSRGRMKSKVQHRLVFRNEGAREARDIHWSFSPVDEIDRAMPRVGESDDGKGSIPVIAPGGEYSYALLLYMGVASRVLCRVEWADQGKPRSIETTLSI